MPCCASTKRFRSKGSLTRETWALPSLRGRAARALLLWREQPSQNVEKDHHRPGKQRQCHDTEPNNGWVEAGVIGKTGGDSHELGVAAVNQETCIHSEFPWLDQVLGN